MRNLDEHKESTSSINIMEGLFVRAISKSCRTNTFLILQAILKPNHCWKQK
uniref:Uncharacterized protein n=1 Tax=Meloidogyne incognita TaxID=6306 RepID=A0A914M2I5_MELIC